MKRKRITRKQAQIEVAKTAMLNAAKAGRKEPNILDAVPCVMTREYLALVRKAYSIGG